MCHGRIEEAEVLIEAARRIDPDSRFTVRALEELRDAKDDAESAESLNAAQEKLPAYPSQDQEIRAR